MVMSKTERNLYILIALIIFLMLSLLMQVSLSIGMCRK
ncbi:hypothetical protein EC5905_4003 [Escherichia coli 5905]|nr:putative membrane protein [Escherichia coli DEC5A]EKH91036.1 hypothetical protein EC5905_4003 [Escherichia coli 5905]